VRVRRIPYPPGDGIATAGTLDDMSPLDDTSVPPTALDVTPEFPDFSDGSAIRVWAEKAQTQPPPIEDHAIDAVTHRYFDALNTVEHEYRVAMMSAGQLVGCAQRRLNDDEYLADPETRGHLLDLAETRIRRATGDRIDGYNRARRALINDMAGLAG
jgi:hypothetical protein